MTPLQLFRKIRQVGGRELFFRLTRLLRIAQDRFVRPDSASLPALAAIIRPDQATGAEAGAAAYVKLWEAKKTFYFVPADREEMAAYLRATCAGQVESLIAKADSICNFEISLFGQPYRFAGRIDWRKDPLSDQTWPLAHWSKIQVVDLPGGVDPKYVWELNRQQFFIHVALAFWFTGGENYAEFVLRQMDDWLENNPPGRGINWVESLEVGTRLVAWIWSLELLRGAKALTPERLARIVPAMHGHAAHIARYLSHYISPNTHLTGEALALFVFSAHYPEDVESAAWEALARNVLDAELVGQVGDDGVHKELSTAYHTYTADYYLQYVLLCRRQQKQVAPAVLARLEKMCEFCLYVERPDGSVPLIGDSDGGGALPLHPEADLTWKDILSCGALLFKRPEFRFRSPELGWQALFLCGRGAPRQYRKLAAVAPRQRSVHFVDSNYIVYRSAWDGGADYLFFDAGRMGFLSAGHSHADYLSLELGFAGKPLLCDVGTFSYHQPEWRRYCRGTRAHNTVCIDGRAQAEPGGSFSWQTIPAPGGGVLENCPGFTLVQGTHGAYPGIVHQRAMLVVEDGFMLCLDQLSASGGHHYEFNYHFAAGIILQGDQQGLLATNTGGQGVFVRPLMFQAPEIVISRACDATGRGFSFPTYGKRQPISTLSMSEDSVGDILRGMLFLPAGPGNSVEERPGIGQSGATSWAVVVRGCRHVLHAAPGVYDLGGDGKFVIECDFLVEQCHNDAGKVYFAVGVSAILSADRPLVLHRDKLVYCLVSLKPGKIESWFAASDKVKAAGIAESFIGHGLDTN